VVTADLAYLRLHGPSEHTYQGSYSVPKDARRLIARLDSA